MSDEPGPSSFPLNYTLPIQGNPDNQIEYQISESITLTPIGPSGPDLAVANNYLALELNKHTKLVVQYENESVEEYTKRFLYVYTNDIPANIYRTFKGHFYYNGLRPYLQKSVIGCYHMHFTKLEKAARKVEEFKFPIGFATYQANEDLLIQVRQQLYAIAKCDFCFDLEEANLREGFRNNSLPHCYFYPSPT